MSVATLVKGRGLQMKSKLPYSNVLGGILVLLIGSFALLLAPQSGSSSAVPSAITSVASIPATVDTPIVLNSYTNDTQSIPPDFHLAARSGEAEQQTVLAKLPSLTPAPTWIWDGTPVPPSVDDAGIAEIGRAPLGPSVANGNRDLQNAIDLWHIGAVSEVIESGNTFVYRLYLVSYPGGVLQTRLFASVFTDELRTQSQHTWQSPQPIGDLTITNVTGIGGMVSFTSSTGTTGTLNMSTGEWQFTSQIRISQNFSYSRHE